MTSKIDKFPFKSGRLEVNKCDILEKKKEERGIMKFGDKLSKLRRKAGLSQEELGEQLNVTRQTISKWELGQSKPDTDKLMEISKLLNVDFNQLVDDEKSLEDNISNIDINDDEVRPRKWLLVVLIIIAIGIIIILANKYVMDRKTNAEKDNGGIFGIFSDVFDTSGYFEDFDKNSFNNQFEMRTGTQYGTFVSSLLDDVITNNKTNSDYLIEVVFGEVATTTPDEIKNIKRNLDNFTDYEVSLDYDNDGYANKITIEEIIEEEKEETVSEFDIRRFNSGIEMSAGTNYGVNISNLLDRIITSNKTNDKHIINVVYGSINTTNESEIRNLKKQLDDWTEYEVILDYDEVGFVNQVTIEN